MRMLQGGSKPEWQWMQQFGRLVFTIERSKRLTDVASLISLQRFYSTNVDSPSEDPQVACQAPASSSLFIAPVTQVHASAAVHVPNQCYAPCTPSRVSCGLDHSLPALWGR